MRKSSSVFIATEPTTKVIIADVSIDPSSTIDQIHGDSSNEPSEAHTDTKYIFLHEDLSSYTIKFLNTTGVQSGEIQLHGIHCKYEVSLTDLGERPNEVWSR